MEGTFYYNLEYRTNVLKFYKDGVVLEVSLPLLNPLIELKWLKRDDEPEKDTTGFISTGSRDFDILFNKTLKKLNSRDDDIKLKKTLEERYSNEWKSLSFYSTKKNELLSKSNNSYLRERIVELEKSLNGYEKKEFNTLKYLIIDKEIEILFENNTILYKGKIIDDETIEIDVLNKIDNSNIEIFNSRIYQTKKKIEEVEKRLSEFSNSELDYYPVLLIPDSIKESILKYVTKQDIYKYIYNRYPRVDYQKISQKPRENLTKRRERTEFDDSDDRSLLYLSIFISIIIIITIIFGHIYPLLILGQIVLYLLYYYIKNSSKTKSYSIDVPNPEYKQQYNEYVLNVEKIKKENSNLKKQLLDRFEKIENNYVNLKRKVYYSKLKPYKTITSLKKNLKRGRTELMFLSLLVKKFGNQIKVDSFLEPYKYQPDFTFICDETNLHIDIEIDEPYSFKDKEPIHEINSDDYKRNEDFLNENWCIIRFSEKQIINQSNECIKVIENFIDSIRGRKLDIKIDLEKNKKWTYEESLVMIYENYRENY